MPEQEVVIRLENIHKSFFIWDKKTPTLREKAFSFFSTNQKRQIQALKNINLEIQKGEFFGIVGRNGSGKSTLLRIILGAYPPDKGGVVEVKGKIIRLALGMGFDAGLSARQNIYLNASLLGLSFKQIGKIFHDIVSFAELENFVDTQIKFFSSGMRSRLAFAIAVHAEADIFLMDEFFGGVGDLRFKKRSEEVFRKNLMEGRTIVHVSHSLSTIREHCDRVLLLDRGEMIAIGKPEEILEKYKSIMEK
jgi:ABC-2 type transport system ATP-binding protein